MSISKKAILCFPMIVASNNVIANPQNSKATREIDGTVFVSSGTTNKIELDVLWSEIANDNIVTMYDSNGTARFVSGYNIYTNQHSFAYYDSSGKFIGSKEISQALHTELKIYAREGNSKSLKLNISREGTDINLEKVVLGSK